MPFVEGTGLKHELTRAQVDDMLARLDGFLDYIYEHVRTKRRQPGDDMISFLCGVVYQPLGRQLTDQEIAGIVHAMVIGGLETTQYAIEEQAQLLCEHPGLFDRLRHDRTKVKAFTEEALRLRSPTHGLSTRTTAQDEVLDGLASIEYAEGNDWLHQPGIMLGTLRLQLRFVAATAGQRAG